MKQASRERTTRTRRRSALGIAAALFACPLAAQEDSTFFRVPAAPDAEVRAKNALSFADDADWLRVAEELQVLLDQHDDAVLPERYHDGETSQYTLHPGAATWAIRLFETLPPAGRERYVERFEETAREGLAVALDEQDRRSLAEIARRHPLTPAGTEALVCLGDLELSWGDAAAAHAAWTQARVRAEVLGEMAATTIAAVDVRLATNLAVDSADTLETAGTVPLASADRWQRADLDFTPFERMRGAESYSLFPVLADGRLLVSTSRSLYCFDAFSSDLLWTGGPPEGWEGLPSWKERGLAERINRSQLLVAPAAGKRVAVTAFQIPTALVGDHEYQGIKITGPIPERRLFAFDLETGAPLWDHRPPEDWDGEEGTFAQRMIVAAPPVVHGSRVLVPCYRMRGRIDFHVACYDIQSGELLWATGLISGQADLNMFGRQDEEFCGAPVVVDGDGVYVLTQLGTLARLDLFTGRIVWESRYEVIPIPKNDGWQDTTRPVFWNNTAPVLTPNVLVATPHDSSLLLGADRETGAVLWSFDADRLDAARMSSELDLDVDVDGDYDTLLGADEDTVYLGGSVVSALRKPGGLHFKNQSGLREPFRARWSVPAPGYRKPRAVLGPEEVVIPTHDQRVVVDRKSGRILSQKTTAESETERGNVLIGDGVLVAVGNRKVTAYFDWDVLLARAEEELRADPSGVEPRINHAALSLRRARAHVEEGKTREARPLLTRARTSLEEVLQEGSDLRAAGQLYEVLTEQARLHEIEANSAEAIAALDAALVLAPSKQAVRDTLLAQEELFRVRDPQRWRDALDRLERETSSLPLPAERLDRGLGWLTAESLFELAPTDLRDADIPIGLWVLLSRAEASARSHDYAGAHRDLHEAIARFGTRELAFGLTVADVASARIARRIELDGRGPFAEFEARAGELFDRAVEADDAELLAEVPRLYPHSIAATRSDGLRLDWALAAGDADAAAALAFARVGGKDKLDEDDAAVLVRLADLFRARGNDAFERDLLKRLGTELPSATSPLPRHGGKAYAALKREMGDPVVAQYPVASFGESLVRTNLWKGSFSEIGAMPLADAESAPGLLRVLIDRRHVIALDSRSPGAARWEHDLQRSPIVQDRTVVTPQGGGRVVIGAGDEVIALSADTGDVAWEFEIENGEIVGVTVDSGIALLLTHAVDPQSGDDRHELFGVEVGHGIPLWSLVLEGRSRWVRPVAGEGFAAVLAPMWSLPASAVVVDVVRGARVRELDLGASTVDDSWAGAWIEDGSIVVPYFSARGDLMSRLVSFDLASGKEGWRVELDEGEELSSVVAWGDRTYLIATSTRTSHGAGARVLSLDSRLARTRPFAELRGDEQMLGLPRRKRTVLTEPALFSYQLKSGSTTVPVRLIPLDGEPGWVYHLQVPEARLHSDVPRPAISERLVAFPYSRKNVENFGREDARIELVDRTGGFHRGTLTLSPEMSHAEVTVYGLGDAILCRGQGRHAGKSISQLEVLETTR